MRKEYVYLHISIFLWGFTGIFARAIDLSAEVLVGYRLGLATIIWVGLSAWTGSWQWLTWRQLREVAVVGALVTIHWIFFYASIKFSNISVGMSCLSMIAVFTSLLEPLQNRQPIRVIDVLFSLLGLLGMGLIFRFAETHRTGILLGLISAVLGALFTIRNKQLVPRYSAQTLTTYELGTGFVYLMVLLPVYLPFFPDRTLMPSIEDWPLLLLFVIGCTVIPYYLSVKALQKVSAFTANLSLNLEPVYGILLAFAIYREHEQLTPTFFVGVTLILTAVLVHSMISLYRQRTSLRCARPSSRSTQQ